MADDGDEDDEDSDQPVAGQDQSGAAVDACGSVGQAAYSGTAVLRRLARAAERVGPRLRERWARRYAGAGGDVEALLRQARTYALPERMGDDGR